MPVEIGHRALLPFPLTIAKAPYSYFATLPGLPASPELQNLTSNYLQTSRALLTQWFTTVYHYLARHLLRAHYSALYCIYLIAYSTTIPPSRGWDPLFQRSVWPFRAHADRLTTYEPLAAFQCHTRRNTPTKSFCTHFAERLVRTISSLWCRRCRCGLYILSFLEAPL